MGRGPLHDRGSSFTHFGVYPDNAILIPNSDIEKLEIVNYIDKQSSNFRLFKNKFAFARNTPNMRHFVNA
jgi:hypothetical protein